MSATLVVFWIASAAVLATVVIDVAVRASAEVARSRLARYEARVHDQLVAYVVGARDDPPRPPGGRFQRRAMRELLVGVAPNLTGEAHARSEDLFRAYGLVDAAHDDLGSRDGLARIRAAEALGAMRAREADAVLAERLDDPDPLVRLACVRALADVAADDALEDVVAALAAADAPPGLVEEVLLAFGTPAVPLLRRQLTAPSPTDRRVAAETLGGLRAGEARADLVEALLDTDGEVAARAARALGRLGDSAATPALVALLDRHGDWFVKVAAARALGALEDPAAAGSLAAALASDEWDVRNAAASSLARLGRPGTDAVIAALDRLPDAAVAHFAGVLDVEGLLGALIAEAAADAPLDRLIRRACVAGVDARLTELASDPALGDYARDVLGGRRQVA